VAMILEVLDTRAGAVRTRLRLDALPLTIGRGYANDLILDDPYVDARHARITRDEEGRLRVEDLGSLNGLAAEGGPARAAWVEAGAGTEVRLGRTTLRFRDPEEPVPPALPDAAEGAEPAPARWLATPAGRLAVSGAALAAVAVYTWLGSYQRSSASEVFAGVLAFGMLGALWAGIWAIAGRVVVHRFHFLGHFAVASAVVLAILAWVALGEWVSFLFPDNPVSSVAEIGVGLALVAALVAGHLGLASALPRGHRWRAGVATSGFLLAVGGLAALTDGESFSDVPQFPGVLKPVRAHWLPVDSREEFARMATELKEEVDALATEE
jgi:hypothetical protein